MMLHSSSQQHLIILNTTTKTFTYNLC